jgi:hypothetical protein
MSLRHPRYRRTGTQGLFNDSSLLFDRFSVASLPE